MKLPRLVIALLWCCSSGAFGQTAAPAAKGPIVAPVEEVTVEGQKLLVDETARNFIMNFAKPAPSGQYALWRDKICVHALGLSAALNVLVEHQVKDVAQRIGAPVDRRDPCRTNIEVVFTTQPQALLDAVVKKNPDILGYENKSKVRHPIQAWYGTVTTDNDHNKTLDDPFADPPYVAGNDTRLYTGITSEFGTILILADLKALQGRALGTISDYIAMLALSQTDAYDRCQEVPSITNLLAADCDASKPQEITDVDVAFLQGLYKSDNGGPELLQRNRIVSGMKKGMAAQ